MQEKREEKAREVELHVGKGEKSVREKREV